MKPIVVATFSAIVLLSPGSSSQRSRHNGLWVLPKHVLHPKLTGDFYCGDGLGKNSSLTLKSDRTFTFHASGDLGDYDENHGRYAWEGDEIVLDPFVRTFWTH